MRGVFIRIGRRRPWADRRSTALPPWVLEEGPSGYLRPQELARASAEVRNGREWAQGPTCMGLPHSPSNRSVIHMHPRRQVTWRSAPSTALTGHSAFGSVGECKTVANTRLGRSSSSEWDILLVSPRLLVQMCKHGPLSSLPRPALHRCSPS